MFFYAWGEPKNILLMLVSLALNYLLGILVEHFSGKSKLQKIILVTAILCNLSFLLYYKYFDFAVINSNRFLGTALEIRNIALPLGISFYTFQAISYLVDIYRKDIAAQKNPVFLGINIAFFPHLIAGPIVRYKTIEHQLTERKESFSDFSEGVFRFLVGFNKKVLIANNLAVVADEAFRQGFAQKSSVVMLWLGALCYSLQIYFDFSGYSDMAIGLGKIFGFHFLENFNYPYAATSVKDFWRRWHISMSTWFRDYVYIPLGGSRVKKGRLIFNLFAVWALTGLWHGASWNFVAWGLIYFLLLCFEKLTGILDKLHSPISKGIYRAFTMFCVMLNWVLFRANGLTTGLRYIKAMLGFSHYPFLSDSTVFYFREYGIYLLFGVLFCVPIGNYLKNHLKFLKNPAADRPIGFGVSFAQLALFLISISFIAVSSHNPFIYFNF
ncbi:MBOAT family O-acyltransferase [Caproicibacter fermentans]|nr:MBOAT family O-acyltransferase [Caproicibacter fermentans]